MRPLPDRTKNAKDDNDAVLEIINEGVVASPWQR